MSPSTLRNRCVLSRRWSLLLLGGAFHLLSCEDGHAPAMEPAADAALEPAADAALEPAADAEIEAGSAQQTPPECFLAFPLDDCCGFGGAATRAAVEGDECLVAWDDLTIDRELADRCWEKANAVENCSVISCLSTRPVSYRVGLDASGRCTFVDECETDDDCVLARWRNACDCPDSWAVQSVQEHPCVLAEGSPTPSDFDDLCPTRFPRECDACDPPPVPKCVTVEGLRSCRSRRWLPR